MERIESENLMFYYMHSMYKYFMNYVIVAINEGKLNTIKQPYHVC